MALLATVLAGCQAIGPGTIKRDRIDYVSAIGESWKQQTLLNITKLRYFDAPVFLDISSVISSYTLQGEASIEATLFSGSRTPNERTLGATGTYIDRPTISYAPLTGQRFINALLRPIPPPAILAMIQAGHPADYILQATVRAINDLYSHTTSPARVRPEDAEFYAVVDALRRVQAAGALATRTEKRRTEEVTLVYFRERVPEGTARDIGYLREALGLRPDAREFVLTFGSPAPGGGEIGLLTRSILQILVELSAGVEVPEAHRTEGRAKPVPEPSSHQSMRETPLVRIRSGTARPEDAYAAVQYRDYWFWIDDRDLASKRVFNFLMMFSSIAETGAVQQAPVLTIPAN
jgi:hypothetical protein